MPRLEELDIQAGLWAFSETLEALGAEGAWERLHSLRLFQHSMDVPDARALAAALRRMPALRVLELRCVTFTDASAAELFRPSGAEDVPHLRILTAWGAGLTPAATGALAASGWRLEELDLGNSRALGAAGVAALLAAPTLPLRRLALGSCNIDADALLRLADAPWPLEELVLNNNSSFMEELVLNNNSSLKAQGSAPPTSRCSRAERGRRS